MENFATYRLTQTGPETQAILDQVNTNTADIAQLRALYEALTQSEPVIIQPSDTWPVADPEEKVIYRVIDRVNTPPESYSDYMWNGTEMVLMATYDNAIDSTPTAGSNNPVASGGVLNYVSTNGSAYDISAANSGTAYADLSAALGTDGANVPAAVRKGGMSIKFVQSSDNKYVQYRLMKNEWSTKPSDWQGVAKEININSKDLADSNAVAESVSYRLDVKNVIESKYIAADGTLATSTTQDLYQFYVDGGERVSIMCKLFSGSAIGTYAFYNSLTVFDDTTLILAGESRADSSNKYYQYNLMVPSGAKTLLVTRRKNTNESHVLAYDLPNKISDLNTFVDECKKSDELLGYYTPTSEELKYNIGYASGSNGEDYSITANSNYRYIRYNIPDGCSVAGVTFVGNSACQPLLFLDSNSKIISDNNTVIATNMFAYPDTHYWEVIIPEGAKSCFFNSNRRNKKAVLFKKQVFYECPNENLGDGVLITDGSVNTDLTTHEILKFKVSAGLRFLNSINFYSGDTSISNKAVYAFYSDYDNPSSANLIDAKSPWTLGNGSRNYYVETPRNAKALLICYRKNTGAVIRSYSPSEPLVLNSAISTLSTRVSVGQDENYTLTDKSLLTNSGLVQGIVGEAYTVATSSAGFKYAILDIPSDANYAEAYMRYSSQHFNLIFIDDNGIVKAVYNTNSRLYRGTNSQKVKFLVPSGATKFIAGCIPSSQNFYVKFGKFDGVESKGLYIYNRSISESGDLSGSTEGTSDNWNSKIKIVDVSNSKMVYIMTNPRNGNPMYAAGFYSSDKVFNSTTFIEGVGTCDGTYNVTALVDRLVDVPRNAKTLLINTRREDWPLVVNPLNEITALVHQEDNLLHPYVTHSIFDVIDKNKAEQLILQSKRSMNLNGGGTVERTPLTLLWFSDIHADQLNAQRILEFYGEFSNYIDDIIHTGDGHNNQSTDYCTLNTLDGAEIILDCIGNHDAYDGTHGTSLEPISEASDVYNAQWADRIGYWNVIQPTDGLGNVKEVCYYYKDYTDYGVRLIVIDNYHVDNEQKQWFEQVLADARTNNLAVVLASHEWPGQIDCYDCSFSEIPQRDKVGDHEKAIWAANYVDSFINAGGEFITWLVGHWHRDFIGTLHDWPNQNIIVCTTDRVNLYGTNDNRVRYTSTQDAFNIISFDTSMKLIKIIRIGNEYDPYLRHKSTLCVNYQNKTVIADGA